MERGYPSPFYREKGESMIEFIKKIFMRLPPPTQAWRTQVPAIGKVYRMRNQKDPFRPVVRVTVLDIKGDYLQYVFCFSDGSPIGGSHKWSNDIETFNCCYEEIEKND